jgi:hypothetical protein
VPWSTKSVSGDSKEGLTLEDLLVQVEETLDLLHGDFDKDPKGALQRVGLMGLDSLAMRSLEYILLRKTLKSRRVGHNHRNTASTPCPDLTRTPPMTPRSTGRNLCPLENPSGQAGDPAHPLVGYWHGFLGMPEDLDAGWLKGPYPPCSGKTNHIAFQSRRRIIGS